MKKTIGLLGALILLSFSQLLGCASKPVQFDSQGPEPVTQWESKTQILDKNKSKSHSLSVDFVAEKRDRLRMNATGTFSTPVAAVVLNKGKLTYVLPQQKKYFQGEASAASMRSILRVDLPATAIFNLLYDEAIPGWTCQKNSLGQVENCENPKNAASVAWLERDGYTKKIRITNTQYEINMTLSRVPTKVQELDRVFSLNIPTGYKNETL